MHGNGINSFQHFKRQKGRGKGLEIPISRPFSLPFLASEVSNGFLRCQGKALGDLIGVGSWQWGTPRRSPRAFRQHRREPLQTSEGKKAGEKDWKFEFPALSPCLFAFRGLKWLPPMSRGKPLETTCGSDRSGRGPPGGLPVSYTHLTLPTKA